MPGGSCPATKIRQDFLLDNPEGVRVAEKLGNMNRYGCQESVQFLPVDFQAFEVGAKIRYFAGP